MHADDYRDLLGDSPALELPFGLKSISSGAPGVCRKTTLGSSRRATIADANFAPWSKEPRSPPVLSAGTYRKGASLRPDSRCRRAGPNHAPNYLARRTHK